MIRLCVELSGENPALAQSELRAVAALLEVRVLPMRGFEEAGSVGVVGVERQETSRVLAERLALARRVLRPLGSPRDSAAKRELREWGRENLRVRFRIRHMDRDGGWRELVDAFVHAGGMVDLERPSRDVHLWPDRAGRWWAAEELERVDRSAYERRRPSRLPFRRPVTLPPRFGRVLVNLARVSPRDQVIDPFLGTGALLAEAALVGARVSGVDREVNMVRGALTNFRFLNLEAESLRVADATESWSPPNGGRWDALVSDPPYGRASPAGDCSPTALVRRVLAQWAPTLAEQARIAVAVPAGTSLRIPGWRLETSIPHRAHRSLTREFRVYVRSTRRANNRPVEVSSP